MIVPGPIVAKKSFGQHFLMDRGVLRGIAAFCDVSPDETLVEIGPGSGHLTATLLSATPARRVIAVELDRELVPVVQQQNDPRLEVVFGDAVRLDYSLHCAHDRSAVAVGNLPYNAAMAILFRLLQFRTIFRRFVLMFQLEVAQRLVASPGNKAYGIPSVLVALSGVPEIVIEVGPEAFTPRPKVKSAVIAMDVQSDDRLDVAGDATGFARFVRAAFGQRRKTLVNALDSARWPKDDVSKALTTLGLDARVRAEACSPETLAALYRELLAETL